jgi:hypothetical protein
MCDGRIRPTSGRVSFSRSRSRWSFRRNSLSSTCSSASLSSLSRMSSSTAGARGAGSPSTPSNGSSREPICSAAHRFQTHPSPVRSLQQCAGSKHKAMTHRQRERRALCLSARATTARGAAALRCCARCIVLVASWTAVERHGQARAVKRIPATEQHQLQRQCTTNTGTSNKRETGEKEKRCERGERERGRERWEKRSPWYSSQPR